MFARRLDRFDLTYQLTVRDLGTGVEHSLGLTGMVPRWSPGSDQIAFCACGDQSLGQIMVVKPDRTSLRQVSPTGRVYAALGLGWSPDGRWLVAGTVMDTYVIEVATGLTLHSATTHRSGATTASQRGNGNRRMIGNAAGRPFAPPPAATGGAA